MKYRILYSLLLLAGSFLLPACTDSDDEAGGSDTPPAGALPAEEFTLNTLPAEPYAEDAIRIVAADPNAQFNSLELMGDGYYLLTFDPIGYPASADEAGPGKGKRSLPNGRTAIRTRGTRDENGTILLPNGEYGRFTKLGDKKYGLSDGSEIDMQSASGSNGTVTYKNQVGMISTVYVDVSEPIVTDATESLCRAWEHNSYELWAYWNGTYIAHGKQTLNNGKVNTEFKAIGEDLLGISQDNFLPADEYYCYKVVFSKAGTYICFYLGGLVNIKRWSWKDEEQGTLYFNHSMDDFTYVGDEYCTIRFAGNQMRFYEDYSDNEDEEDSRRIVAVTTLTATN